ncbi:uncharacterized protein F54H12.2-like [Amphiura filiformis]|uniref:uncharacterized protein F54H12.2-like n=1 Tax=Amphiura filiformis TaxID=82378 RepID=UPI003B20EB00
MSLVSNHSCPCSKTETDLFSVPPTQTDILSSQFLEYKPLNAVTSDGPLEFTVPGSPDGYLDLSQTQLYVRAKITLPDGADIPQDAPVGPTNLFLHSMFNQVDVHLNDRMVSVASNTYAYRAMIETLLTYGSDATKSHLTSSLFYKDTPYKMDICDPALIDDEANVGLKKRAQFTHNSRVVDMVGMIHSDIFCQEKFLLGGVDLKLKLHRSKNEFCLLRGIRPQIQQPAYRVQIMDATLFVRSAKLNPTLTMSHAKELERGVTAKYPIRRVDVKSFSIPQGNLSFVRESLFTGQIPRRIIFGLVDNTAYNGSYAKNPYFFKHFNLNYRALHCNGETIPWKPLRPRFEEADAQPNLQGHIMAYQTLFQGTSNLHKDRGVQVAREDYAGGYTLFAFDLSPDASDDAHLNLLRNGSVRLELQFQVPLPNTVNLVVYAEWDSMLEITKSRSIVIDYDH